MLAHLFNSKLDQKSPVQTDVVRVVNYDGEEEIVTFKEVDYSKIQQSHGKVSDWSLNALLAAGVNPNFSIHTGYNSRIEGVDDINSMIAELDNILAEDKKDEK